MPQRVDEVTTTRLAKASFSVTQTESIPIWGSSSQDGVDKMEVSSDYHDIVTLCRFYYDHDGLAYTTINKQVELGINGFAINPGTCTDKELLVYEYLNPLILKFLRGAAQEFLTSGLVIPETVWETVKGTDINPKLRKLYKLPTDLWYRDPMTIEVRKTPLPNRLLVLVKASDDDIFFIQNEGKYTDGTEDKETYRILVEQYPDFVRAIKAGKYQFRLEDPLVIRRYPKSGQPYPTPYLTPALELFMHKRNMRKMDYAIASRIIEAIQVFKLGSDDFPLTEDDEDVVEDLKAQMRWRERDSQHERVFQLFANHTLSIEWVTPDVAALLSEEKYRSSNDDIMTALGLPRVIISGETQRSGTSNSAMALLPPKSTIESMRGQLLEFPRKLYKEIKERNNFRGIPEPYYHPIVLQSVKDLIEQGKNYYEYGIISKTGWAEMGNLKFDTEMERRVLEEKKMKELGLDERPDIPFSNPPQRTGRDNNSEDTNGT